MTVTTTLPHDIETARRQYEEDGATVLRGVVPLHWIERIAEATDKILTDRRAGLDFSRPGEGRFFGDVFSYLWEPEYAAFIREAGLAEVAAELMRSREVRFFYDQLLVKEPGTPKPTPWHQDYPYWPLSGNQIVSFWVPMDSATPETGVVAYVKGSHKWQAFFPSENWSDNQPPVDATPADFAQPPEQAGTGATSQQKRTLADIRDHPENYEFLTWDVEPGDIVVHHAATVHGAPGNSSMTMRRRALATRWMGDDVRWDETRPHFMRRTAKANPAFPYPTLETGDPVDDPFFPKLWPA